jgi:4-nitrophenyl phosphatase
MKISNYQKLHSIRGLILDMDGVLWRDSTPIGDLPAIFNKIKDHNWEFVMATNNSSKSPKEYARKFAGFGVEIDPWQVITAGLTTASYLKKHYPEGAEIFIVGENSLVNTLIEQGFIQGGNNPVAVVAAIDRGINYQKLTQATLLLRKGIPFIGTNPDKSYPIPEGEAPGSGAILAALEAASGVSPTIMGKPQPEMYKMALERLGTTSATTLVVGDRLETDILGAQNAGCLSALVLSGVTSMETARKWQPPPDIISGNLTSLLDELTLG